MRRLYGLICSAMTLSVPAAAIAQPAPAAAPAQKSIPAEIGKFFADYFRAVEAGDPDGILAFIDEDFVIKWPVGEPISDRRRLRTALASFQERFRQEIKWEILEARVQGDWAWVRSTETPTHYPKAGGTPRTLAGSRLTILRKVGGKWLMHRDQCSLNALPAAG